MTSVRPEPLKRCAATADATSVSSRARSLLVPAAVAAACALGVGAMALLTPAFTDYELEVEPALMALRSGDVGTFLSLAPAYGGSLVLRAPFALLPGVWDGGDLALFRSMAAPCLAAAAILAVFLWSRARALGRPRAAAWMALGLVAANPLTLPALEIGHPEELLGGVLCVAAALAAGARRPALAGLLLGMAVANKPWALLAVIPVAAIASERRTILLVTAGAVAAAVTLPVVLAGGALAEARAVATDTGAIFQPWQIWWFLGDHGSVVTGTLGVKPDYRSPPEWLTGIGHPLALAIPLAAALMAVPRLRGRPWHAGLLLLALVLLLRCLLDPWNVSYYSLPFLLALVAWEVQARRLPALSLAATLLAWLTLVTLPETTHPDLQAAAYLAWSVPLALALAAETYAPEWWRRQYHRRRGASPRAAAVRRRARARGDRELDRATARP